MTTLANKHCDLWTKKHFRKLAPRALKRVPETFSSNIQLESKNLQSDFDLTPNSSLKYEVAKQPRSAAVLVPVVMREKLSILLTQRAAHLPSHAGQIAFPGGKIEKSDAGPIAAALRETEEEIGLKSNFIEPLGYLDSYLTGTGFHIVPLVAMVKPDFSLKLNPTEVDDAFEVPLNFLMNEANYEKRERKWQGYLVSYYAIPYHKRFIWGATAGMIRNMHERFKQA